MHLMSFLFAAAYAADLGVIGKLRCYTVHGRRNLTEKALTCGVPIPTEGNCSAFGNNRDTEVDGQRDHGDYRDIARRSEKVCSVSYRGRCGRQCGPIDELCFTIIEQSATYPNALRDCANRGGHLFIPDNDADLAELLKMIDGKIKRFWIGGGTIFYRTCNRVKPNEEGVEPAVTYTIEDRSDREGVLGYVRTRLATERFPYVCAKSDKHVDESECLRIDGYGVPITKDCKLPLQDHISPVPRCNRTTNLAAFPVVHSGSAIRLRSTPGRFRILEFGGPTICSRTLRNCWSTCLSGKGNSRSFYLLPTERHQERGRHLPFTRRRLGPTSEERLPRRSSPIRHRIKFNDLSTITYSHRGQKPQQDYYYFYVSNIQGLISDITVTHGKKTYNLPIFA